MPLLNAPDAVGRIDQARNSIKRQLIERDSNFRESGPVFPWTLVTRAQSYVFDLPAESLREIRLHTDAMNGTLGAYTYLHYPTLDGELQANIDGYAFLGEGVPAELWAREHDIPGKEDIKYGYHYRGLTVCDLTVPRQQNVCNLYRLLKASPKPEGRLVFIEIGAGYGSFALDARPILGDCAYVIIDLPETLIYSAAYLSAHQPELRIYVYAPGDDVEAVLREIDKYDVAFVPNYRASAIKALPYVDIGFNSISFPEMAQDTVRQYLGLITPKLRRFFISVNYRSIGNKSVGVDNLLSEQLRLFPSPQDYRSQVGLSDVEYDNIEFRPTFIGITNECLPLEEFELRCVGQYFGHITIHKSKDYAAVISKRGGGVTKMQVGRFSGVRRLMRRIGLA